MPATNDLIKSKIWSRVDGHVCRKYPPQVKACADTVEPVKVMARSIASSGFSIYSSSRRNATGSQLTMKLTLNVSAGFRRLIFGDEGNASRIAFRISPIRFGSGGARVHSLRMLLRNQSYAGASRMNERYAASSGTQFHLLRTLHIL